MTEKVYIVTAGVYSSYCIYAVFSNREAADRFVAVHWPLDSGDNAPRSYDAGRVEEWDVDKTWPEMRIGDSVYRVTIWLGGNNNDPASVEQIGIDDGDQYIEALAGMNQHKLNQYFFETYVIARDEAHAIKIASEQYTQVAAEAAGIA